MDKKIKVAICDDVIELCNYFKNYFDMCNDIEFIGMSHNSADCIKLVENTHPDILLLDIQLETYSAGTDVIPVLKEVSPNTKIIILTVHEEPAQIFSALSNGATDYIFKSVPFKQILEKINQVYSGSHTLSNEITNALLQHTQSLSSQNLSLFYCINIITKLSKAEYDILLDLFDNLSYKDIAKKRFVEEITVRSQVSRLLKKFNKTEISELLDDLNHSGVIELLKKNL